MSNLTNHDGGPAFPAFQPQTHDGSWNQNFEWGMSLRDYFAGHALTGLITLQSDCLLKEIAIDAYQMADRMLEVRKETSKRNTL